MRVFNESRWMAEKGHHIIIAAPKHSPLYKKASQEGWEVCDISFDKFGMLRDFFRVRSLLKKIRPHVLNTHGNTDTKVALTAARGLEIPCVIRSRHSTPRVRNSWYNRILYKKLTCYIFTSANFVKHQLVRDLDVSENRIFSLPSGFFPPSDLPEHEEARQNLATELNVSPQTRFVGFVGRLSNEKGLSFLTDAFAKISNTPLRRGDMMPDYHLVLVGKGGFLSALEDQVQEKKIRDKVHFLGFRENPWPYFRAFDCHVLASSKYEAAAQSVQQAMYARCPVVGTDAGGIPDLIVHEKTGLLVPPDNSNLLAEAILNTITAPDASEQRAENAFQFVSANHTMDAMGGKILDIYSKVLPA
ncbi:glycosyltransferase family 4 protein [Desulfonema magnum]|uniref:Glycosyltransferase, family I n=1 Tax=Desulfonema magnum TaxID=45655 RepID=A0A975GU57_9BACT|nr:glycosyltransferase family 4 protein [Desulfonema magnum]QTA93824.1 Glycosyltransferase, family I [Desulfonema magnum]